MLLHHDYLWTPWWRSVLAKGIAGEPSAASVYAMLGSVAWLLVSWVLLKRRFLLGLTSGWAACPTVWGIWGLCMTGEVDGSMAGVLTSSSDCFLKQLQIGCEVGLEQWDMLKLFECDKHKWQLVRHFWIPWAAIVLLLVLSSHVFHVCYKFGLLVQCLSATLLLTTTWKLYCIDVTPSCTLVLSDVYLLQ